MADRFKDLPDIATTQPDRLIKYRISEDRFSAEVLLPGLWYTDFDKKIGGKLSLWAFAKFDEARGLVWQAGLAYYSDLCDVPGRTLFVVHRSCSFSQRFHSIRYSTHFGVAAPLRSVMDIVHIGKSSMTSVLRMCEKSTGAKISEEITSSVYVDQDTRRPVAFPDQFVQNSRQHIGNFQGRMIQKKALPAIPSIHYVYPTKALHSDCDWNLHLNHATYIRWCSDAASKAAIGGHFKYFKRPIEMYPIQFLDVQYLGEVLANQAVLIKCWESTSENRCLYFMVFRDQQPVLSAKMQFYEGYPIEVNGHLRPNL